MGVTSAIHGGIQTPPPLKKSISNTLLHSNPTSVSISSRNLSLSQRNHSPLIRLRPVRNGERVALGTIAYAKRTEEEDGVSTASEWDGSNTQSSDDSSDVGKSHQSSSGSSLKEKEGPDSFKSSVTTVALCVCSAVAFGVGVGFKDGIGKASEFFAGYLLEQSLSVDNLFVFVLIFKYFKVPLMYQNRVLSYGIAGAVVFRLTLILLGTATLQRFEAVNLLLAGILLYSSVKLFGADEDEEDLSDNFIVKTCQKFIPVTASYDGNRFFTMEDGVWKAKVLGRLHLYFSPWLLLS